MTVLQAALTDLAHEDLDSIKDNRTAAGILHRIRKLREEPTTQGKPLGADLNLKSHYGVRAAGQRSRVLCEVIEGENFASIEVIGMRREGSRKDVSEIARKRLGRK